MANHVVQADRAVFVRRLAVASHSDRSYRACIYYLLNSRFAASGKQISRTSDVDVINVLWILGPKPIIGGDVVDLPATLYTAQERNQVSKIANYDLAAKSFNVIPAAGIPDKDSDTLPFLQQQSHNMTAYEAGGSCYESEIFTHKINLAACTACNTTIRLNLFQSNVLSQLCGKKFYYSINILVYPNYATVYKHCHPIRHE